jgi:ATP-dependent helicase/nuclease subunit A
MKSAPKSPVRQLRPEQATAAHTLDRHVSVTAGPGAGKTLVLVERYLEILRTQKGAVDNIVAITFTNRAANEMRERVRKAIDMLLAESNEDERRRWLRHKRALEGAVITTIHGFCSRLLHEFPVEANIDPQFTLLDEHQSAMLLESVVEQSLTEAIQHGSDEVTHMAEGLTRGIFSAALVSLYRAYRGQGLSIDEIEAQTREGHATEAAYSSALAELDSQMALFLGARRLSPSAEGKRASAAEQWPRLRSVLAAPPTVSTIAKYCQAIEDFRDTRPNKGTHSVVERLDELLWGEKSSPADCLRGCVPAIGFDLLARGYSLQLLRLLRQIEVRLESEKQRLSAVDFDDLQLRTLRLLTDHPEVRARIENRYRFFLVDEFQDTNGLQRDLLKQVTAAHRANLFIVSDRKQSIYGFRGADVDVFAEMTEAIKAAGGIEQPLNLNFRSQRALTQSLNFLFQRVFSAGPAVTRGDLSQLGYVAHETSEAARGDTADVPLVELLVTVAPNDEDSEADEAAGTANPQLDLRESEALHLVRHVLALAESGIRYGDIAVLFRAMTNVWVYEAAFRRAGIPYLTVQGKGFYQREEIVDLIQLLRFLDNTTDEIALAAILRSPLCGLSDDALFALRCAPAKNEVESGDRLRRRNLLSALRHHEDIAFIDEAERKEVERARRWLEALIQRRHRYSISALLRCAVRSAELLPVIAANFDGTQRVANVEKLFRLAEQFEKSGNLIRDFVRYVEEFDAIGGRESEGPIDESANVVRLMTIHQSKGLEFPVVIIPELHREPTRTETAFMLDRHKGFTTQIPDGRGYMVRGALYNELRQRNQWREQFESMRLLFVAATRAEDRLVLSGAIEQKALPGLLKSDSERWLAWIWQALELPENAFSDTPRFNEADFRVTINRSSAPREIEIPYQTESETEPQDERTFEERFPLLQPVSVDIPKSLRRFSVTQLLNFQRCARQYYFDRMLRTPGAEERSVWNDAEAPEPPANLTATLKGAVIHRFCETFREGDDPERRLAASFDDVVAQHGPQLVGRTFDIDRTEAVRALLPLASNYLRSDVFRRVSPASRMNSDNSQFEIRNPQSDPGLWSELRFRLRRPRGILTGTIDKLLITRAANGEGVDVEIIDFKTNRFRSPGKGIPRRDATFRASKAVATRTANIVTTSSGQGVLDFEVRAEEVFDMQATESVAGQSSSTAINDQVQVAAMDYSLQMQAYALAVRELLSSDVNLHSLRATLHFIDPNVEIALPASLLEQATCARAVDDAMHTIASLDATLDAEMFPPVPATHCRICKFLDLCAAGREWVLQRRQQ